MVSNQDQYNAKNAELIAKFEDLIKKAKGFIYLNSQKVGAAAGADSLDQIAVGSATAFRQATGTEFRAFGVGRDYGWNGYLDDPDVLFDSPGSCFVSPSGGNADASKWWNTYAPSIWIVRNSGAAVLVSFDSSGRGGFRFANPSQKSWATGWFGFITTANSTVDPNGNYKKASPIFRLANEAEDAMDTGYTDGGAGVANNEAPGVTATHDDFGVYTVRGSLGFSAEGWKFEAPQDDNKNILCFVETDVADDGVITVRVFKKRFDYETAMIVAGDPMDIPDGRFISLRLAMPKSEQPQLESSAGAAEGDAATNS